MKAINFFRGYIIFVTVFSVFLFSGCEKDDFDPNATTVSDIDGNVYNILKIGDQYWMMENLKTTRYNNGDSVNYVSSDTEWKNQISDAYCYYNNDSANIVKFGLLYNWYAVQKGHLAPKGWRIANEEDWTELKNYVSANISGADSIAKALASVNFWTADIVNHAVGNDTLLNNESKFNGVPGGYRHYSGKFENAGKYAGWWSYHADGESYTWSRNIQYNSKEFADKGFLPKSSGFSVRCVRD